MIPAHNEAAVIGRLLSHLTGGARPGELDIVVVCNGCADDTAAVARRFEGVRIIETEIPSKSHALNLGDAAAQGFPRFYVDADARVALASVRQVAKVLREGHVLAAAPRLVLEVSRCTWAVRAYHRIWIRMPYVTGPMLGSGIYALSREGRARFDRFPDIIADDEYIRHRFAAHEKATVAAAEFEHLPPTNLRSLVHIGVRRHEGGQQIREIFPESSRGDYALQRLALLRLTLDPRLWPDLTVYAYVKVAIIFSHLWNRWRGTATEWKRDETSRTPRAQLPPPARARCSG